MKLKRKENKVNDQRKQINFIRDGKEIEPVSVGILYVDCDPTSMDRMGNALLLWDTLGQESINWTMADNSIVPLTKTELEALHNNALIARGIRSAQLHQYATGLKSTLPVADDNEMFNGDTWPAF